MERIARAIFASKYSIYDLSRCRGEGDELLARFNMPLELGIAMARRYTRTKMADRHDWLVLVPQGHAYARFISDLAGYDPVRHDGTVQSLVRGLMAWLATGPDAVSAPTAHDLLLALPGFIDRKDELKRQWGDEIPWADIVLAAHDTVPL